jgi:isoleucyl-tRNA synthetase
VYSATKKIESFIDNLSNWYIRRSRKRFWKSEDDGDKENAYQTLYDVLVTLSKIIAPFTPFIADEIYRNLTGEESVHLVEYPEANEKLINEKLNEDMILLREVVTAGLQFRAEKSIKVRQPLSKVLLPQKYESIFDRVTGDSHEWGNILYEELNVKGGSLGNYDVVEIDTKITPELKLEGEAREIIRAIQEGRKKAGFNVEDRIILGYTSMERVFENVELKTLIEKEILATESKNIVLPDAEYSGTAKIEDEDFSFSLTRM